MFKYSFILALLLAQSLCSLGQQHSGKTSSDGNGSPAPQPPPRSPQSHFDLGPFTFESYENTTKYQDKMRFSKSFKKLVISSKLFGPNTPSLTTLKMSRLDELVRCENLTLAKADMEPLVDCRPLESYIREGLNDKVSKSGAGTNSNKLYVRRTTVRVKGKSPWMGDDGGRQDFVMYPLREDVVRNNIKSSLASNNLTSADFADANADEYGFYTETIVPTALDNVRCTANVFLSYNDTILYESLNGADRVKFNQFADTVSGDGEQEASGSLVQEFVDFLNQVSRDGFFISVQDASCSRADSFIPFSIDQDFTLVLRNKFPYLTCRHNIVTRPLSHLWEYFGEIKQTRDESNQLGQGDHPQAYNTSIRVESISGLFDSMSFKIDQEFANEDANSGWEEMILAHKKLIAIVRGNWSVDSLVKMLLLHPVADKDLRPSEKPAVMLIYNDQPDKDYVSLTLNIERQAYKQLIGGAQALYSGGALEDEAGQHQSDGHGEGSAPRAEL